jgi:hypothetical protein
VIIASFIVDDTAASETVCGVLKAENVVAAL